MPTPSDRAEVLNTDDGLCLHYTIRGSGPALLLIHGLGSSGADWAAQVEAFAPRYTVIAPDLRGHGRSDKPPGPYTMRRFADDLAALLRARGIASAHVVGLSLGGGVAFQMALQTPALVRTLTIVNSAPELVIRTLRERLTIWQRFAVVRLLGMRRMGEVLAPRLFPHDAALQAQFVARFAANDARAYLAALRALVGWSVADRLDAIACPTLVIAADQDYTPLSLKESYVAKIAGARLAVIPDSHHALPMERPQAFNECLAAFLEVQAEQ